MHHIELPIIVSNNGDAEIFESVVAVQDYLEVADVLDEQYSAYDSKGRILPLLVQNGKVIVQNDDSQRCDADELRRILTRYLTGVKIPTEWLNQATLEQLVERRMAFDQQFYYRR